MQRHYLLMLLFYFFSGGTISLPLLGLFRGLNEVVEVVAAVAFVLRADGVEGHFFNGLCFKLLSYLNRSHRPGFSNPVYLARVNCSSKFSTVKSHNCTWKSC